jgi:hypothetical protein
VVDDRVVTEWPKEPIPNEDPLYKRVPAVDIIDDAVGLRTFRDQGSGMSTDWGKYSTPEQTKARATNPDWCGGVINLMAGQVRLISGLTVEHEPDRLTNNRAHTEVFGDKKSDPQVRVMLRRISKWALRYNKPTAAL